MACRSGKILFEAGVEAEPVLAIVDFEALERSQPVVGTDDGLGLTQIGGAITTAARHGFAARERMHDRCSHAALDLVKLAGRLAHRAAPAGSSSVFAAAWTAAVAPLGAGLGSSFQKLIGLQRLGVDFIESGDVVVPLEQRGRRPAALDGARVEPPDRGQHGMVVRVEDVLLEFAVAGDVNLRDAMCGHRIDVVNGSKLWFFDET